MARITSNIHPPGVPAHYLELVRHGGAEHEVRIIESGDSPLDLGYLVVDDPPDSERVVTIGMARRGIPLGSCWPENADEGAGSDSRARGCSTRARPTGPAPTGSGTRRWRPASARSGRGPSPSCERERGGLAECRTGRRSGRGRPRPRAVRGTR